MSTLRESIKFHFNKKTIESFPAHDPDSASREQEYSDTDVIGLKVLVSKSGRKFFYFRYCLKKHKRAIKVGEFPMMSVKLARQIAGKHRISLNQNLDPHIEKDKYKEEMTFKEFALDEYIPFAKNDKKTWKQDLSRLKSRMFEAFGNCSLSTITTRDVQAFINKLKNDMSASSSNRFLSLMKRMFNLAIQWEFVEQNPCKGIAKAKEAKRERFLSNKEIKRFLEALSLEENQIVANAIKLLLLTGTRKNEVLKLKWENVNLEKKTFYLTTTKNGIPRTVLLNDLALGVLESMKAFRQMNNPYVFVSKRGSVNGHIVEPKKVFFGALETAGIEHCRLHDLRHTYASILVNNGVSLYKVKELLGHRDISVTQRYSHLQDDSLREATANVSDVIRKLA
ncbi:MAG: tyrosine-type recombinase/integrase [Verrucomicrobiota bacterium]|nr:tyrosine-type recombinase/integrase [Verrucomicrobiota bacterium]